MGTVGLRSSGELTGVQQERTYDTTFVTCIEAGPMEQEAVLLFRTLRRWGGRFATAPAMAVMPRFGPLISAQTRGALRELEVEFACLRPEHRGAWDKFLNKSTALAHADGHASSETVTFLDTDLLIASEPSDWALALDEDFTARPAERSLGTTGDGDVNESYWREVCRRFGIDIESLGWVTSWPEEQRIRRYWHTGAFVYRRATGLGGEYLRCHLKHHQERLASSRCGIYFTDQVAVTLASRLLNLRCREMSFTHNYNVNARAPQLFTPQRMACARVIHYHDSMWPQNYHGFLLQLAAAPQGLRQMVEQHGPLGVRLALHRRVMRKALSWWRERRYAAFGRTCQPY